MIKRDWLDTRSEYQKAEAVRQADRERWAKAKALDDAEFKADPAGYYERRPYLKAALPYIIKCAEEARAFHARWAEYDASRAKLSSRKRAA